VRHAEVQGGRRLDRAGQLVEPGVAGVQGQLDRVPFREVGQLHPDPLADELPDEPARIVIVPADPAERAADRERSAGRPAAHQAILAPITASPGLDLNGGLVTLAVRSQGGRSGRTAEHGT